MLNPTNSLSFQTYNKQIYAFQDKTSYQSIGLFHWVSFQTEEARVKTKNQQKKLTNVKSEAEKATTDTEKARLEAKEAKNDAEEAKHSA